MIDIMDKTPAIPAHEIRPDFEYVYHWHRIIPAAASLAIGIGAVLWFWPTALPSEKVAAAKTAEPVAGGPLKAKSIVVDLPMQIVAPIANAAPTKSGSSNATPATPASIKSSVAFGNADTHVAGANAKTVQLASPVKEANNAVANKEVTSTKTATPGTASASEPQTVAVLKAINDAPAPAAGMKPGQVKIADKGVKEASLRQVIDQDPLDLNKGAIGLTKTKAVKVVFSANVGKPNEQVNYLWYLDGKLKAKVATRSTADASTMASKFISYDAPGIWQVQMTNASGKVLAESAFSAKRIQ